MAFFIFDFLPAVLDPLVSVLQSAFSSSSLIFSEVNSSRVLFIFETIGVLDQSVSSRLVIWKFKSVSNLMRM